ncbi:hypothetical protein KIM372_02550 [Bombiscardovia nodaiensis]|uniref:RCC1 repeat-containing protein n=1 Tax=Bombiscardovia nodaiensis TaxID=2932181 RepID=A0ABM8B6Q0_9BIFI|nr:hypothetical protein KIM372_02550 [Bombiscardovia nodaiensis]
MSQATPPAGVRYVQISAAGRDHFVSYGLGNNGRVYSWGSDSNGGLGNIHVGGASTVPVEVGLPLGVRITKIYSGNGDNAFALDTNGNWYTWGANNWGKANGSPPPINGWTPTMINTPERLYSPSSYPLTAIASGFEHSLGLTSDGKVYSWGNNDEGQLGYATNSIANVPHLVDLPSGISFTAVSALEDSSLALSASGQIYAWGRMDYGTPERQSPVPVYLPGGVSATSISAGSSSALAMDSSGNVYSWGSNLYASRVTLPAGSRAVSIASGNAILCDNGHAYRLVKGVLQQIAVPIVSLTSVSFGGTPAAGFALKSSDGMWHATTPAHASGTVTVSIGWKVGGSPQPNTALQFTFAVVHKVTFDPDGGSGSTSPGFEQQTVKEGERAVQPSPNPTRPGYIFNGWYLGNDPYNFSSPVTADLALKAHWSTFSMTPDSGLSTGGTRVVITPPNPSDGVSTPQLTITNVQFGGQNGLNLTYHGTGPDAGKWTVTTPAHAAGPVNVNIQWTLDSTPQSDHTFRFTYFDQKPLPTAGAIPLEHLSGEGLLGASGVGALAYAAYQLSKRGKKRD